jgi:hypothetical protein
LKEFAAKVDEKPLSEIITSNHSKKVKKIIAENQRINFFAGVGAL